jgi:suppressor for copper-sensitivity B
MPMNVILRTVAAFALGIFATATAEGKTFTPAAALKPDIKAELMVGDGIAAAPDERWVGVRLDLGPGWKTYWKSPGEAGLPNEFDWSGSSNLADAQVQWPAPLRLSILGLETVGYTQEVLFPVRLRVQDPNAETSIRLKLAVYACSTICVRQERMLEATFRPGDGGPSQPAIDAWRSKVPGPASDALSILSIERSSTGPASLRIAISSSKPLLAPDVFIEGEPPLSGDKPVVTFDHGNRATLAVDLPGETADGLRKRTVTATVVSGGDSVLAVSPAIEAGGGAGSEASAARQPAPAPSGLLWLVGIALAGGFILNLMPCVFPVLSLKLLSFVDGGTADRGQIRRGFAASAAGIFVSFLALAGVLAGMKAAGAGVGWGIQFQQPVFLAAMAVVLSLFAASQFDLLHLAAPPALLTKVSGIAGGTSTTSHFLSGFVATLLATPCSAPLVGTAVGFALSQGTAEILLIFASLGIGMATPYLFIALFPAVARVVPRPGPWLGLVKRLFGVALLATAGWLLLVLGEVAGISLALSIGVAVAVSLAVLGLMKGATLATVARAGAVVAVIMTALAAFTPQHRPSATAEIPWRAFSAHELQSLVAAGRTVFVDVTADWCITCRINKALAINRPQVAGRLSSDVVPLRADWTRPDPEIARFLQQHGRFGIPFNIVFGPAAPRGIALSEILSTSSVTAAFNDAAARTK